MMRSATAFLPASMITFMNLERSTDTELGIRQDFTLGYFATTRHFYSFQCFS